MRVRSPRWYGPIVSFVVAGMLAGGCATVAATGEPARSSGLLEVVPAPAHLAAESADTADSAITDVATVGTPAADALPPDASTINPILADLIVAQATRPERVDASLDGEDEYDPWEPFNEKMFDFNYKVDRYVLKPVARGYRFVMPEQFQIMIDNGFHNIKVVPRVVNNLLQGKFEGALVEVSRFVVNSTLGVGGLFDAAKHAGLERRNEDFGQTLGVWGAPAGPYLVLPFLEPMTVRDGIGRAVDGFMDPLSYFLPFFFDRLGMKIGEVVNDRALNYELFQGVEETTLDLYSSVRHFYLKRREQQIKE